MLRYGRAHVRPVLYILADRLMVSKACLDCVRNITTSKLSLSSSLVQVGHLVLVQAIGAETVWETVSEG